MVREATKDVNVDIILGFTETSFPIRQFSFHEWKFIHENMCVSVA